MRKDAVFVPERRACVQATLFPESAGPRSVIDCWEASLARGGAPMALKLQRPLPDEALGIVAKGKKKDSPSALAGQHTLDWHGRVVSLSYGRGVAVRVSQWPATFSHREKGRGGGHLRLGPRLRSRVDEAHMTFSGALGLRMRAKRVADMDDGHVDEIEQRSVRAGFPKYARLCQLLGDLDQTIDFRHRVVPPQ
jgi:hypothetical protein